MNIFIKYIKKFRKGLYQKYYPTFEWLKLPKKESSVSEKVAQETIEVLKTSYILNHHGDIFKPGKNFHDVCYSSIDFEEKFLSLLNHPLMIRLMLIKQLSMSYRLFFSANHNRFSHSLGTYESVKAFINKLRTTENEELNEYIEENQDLIKIYALIHDIGHHPFSHSLEFLFGQRDKDMLPKVLEDDGKLRRDIINIIDEKGFELLQKLVKAKPNASEELTSETERPLKSFELILKKCIDSPLDADRMDFIKRDRLLCFGDNIESDIKNIISYMIPFKNERNKWILAYKNNEECVDSIINFLTKRHYMYTNVYENDDKVVMEELIARSLYYLIRDKNLKISDFEFFTDNMIIYFIRVFGDKKHKELLNKALLGHNYKKIISYSAEDLQKKNKKFKTTFKDAQESIENRELFEKNLSNKCKLDHNKNPILYHFPREYISNANEIILLDDNGTPTRLEDHEYYRTRKTLDEKKAQYFQMFLLDEGDVNFESKFAKVLEIFEKEYLYHEEE